MFAAKARVGYFGPQLAFGDHGPPGSPSVPSMDADRQPEASSRTTLYRWGAFLLVGIVASTIFGPLALMVLSIVAGGAAIWSGARSAGWPRPVFIVLGSLLVIAPVYLLVDVWFGPFV